MEHTETPGFQNLDSKKSLIDLANLPEEEKKEKEEHLPPRENSMHKENEVIDEDASIGNEEKSKPATQRFRNSVTKIRN